MANIKKIGSTDRAQVPGVGVLQNHMVKAGDFNPLVDRVNSLTANDGTLDQTLTSITATNINGGTTGVTTLNGLVVTGKSLVQNHTGIAIATTAAGTLAVVTSGLVAGLITSTSAAAVTLTLDSVANIITAFATAGVTIVAGTNLQFLVDNTAGANTITVAVDSGATIAVCTPAITGGATLTVSTANAIALFNLYIATTTTGKLSRII